MGCRAGQEGEAGEELEAEERNLLRGENGKSLSTGGFRAETHKYSIHSGSIALRAEGTQGSCI